MKSRDDRTVVFLKTFRDCFKETWKETDRQYHIPKSRFKSSGKTETGREAVPPGDVEGVKEHFFRRLRTCFSNAWEAADRHYHIPKSRHGKAA